MDGYQRLVVRFTRWIFAAAIGVFPSLLASATLRPEEPNPDERDLPFQALVVRDGTNVYSGPGQEHYTTNQLSRGAVVNVLRFDPGDWIAVAPSDDEFSLIPESGVEWLDEWRATVKTDGLQVWVGTRTGAVDQPLWQVKMRRGDEVEVLGQVNWPSPEGFSTTWLQIVPPPGEYRWIRRHDLQFPDSRTRLPNASSRGNEVAARPLPRRVDHPWPDEPPIDSTSAETSPRRAFVETIPATIGSQPPQSIGSARDDPANDGNSGWRRAAQPIRFANAHTDVTSSSSTAPRHELEFVSSRPSALQNSASPLPNMRDAATAPITPSIDQPLTDRLRELDIQLGMEIVKPAEHWNLQPFADGLRQFQATAGDQELRQIATLQNKLERLRETQQNLVRAMRLPVALPSVGTGPIGAGVASPTSVTQDMQYDAVGWLNELVQNHGGSQSTYVLQDDQGRITHHISPSPGLNLHRYLKTKIGVKGVRGFHQRYNVEHITADRIVVLERSSAITR